MDPGSLVLEGHGWELTTVPHIRNMLEESVYCATSLSWVTEFKNLGVSTALYYNLNLASLLSLLKERCLSWSGLPLNLLGHIHILKIILLPKFNYMFHNSPVWILASFFREVDCCISSFMWNGSAPHFSCKIYSSVTGASRGCLIFRFITGWRSWSPRTGGLHPFRRTEEK